MPNWSDPSRVSHLPDASASSAPPEAPDTSSPELGLIISDPAHSSRTLRVALVLAVAADLAWAVPVFGALSSRSRLASHVWRLPGLVYIPLLLVSAAVLLRHVACYVRRRPATLVVGNGRVFTGRQAFTIAAATFLALRLLGELPWPWSAAAIELHWWNARYLSSVFDRGASPTSGVLPGGDAVWRNRPTYCDGVTVSPRPNVVERAFLARLRCVHGTGDGVYVRIHLEATEPFCFTPGIKLGESTHTGRVELEYRGQGEVRRETHSLRGVASVTSYGLSSCRTVRAIAGAQTAQAVAEGLRRYFDARHR